MIRGKQPCSTPFDQAVLPGDRRVGFDALARALGANYAHSPREAPRFPPLRRAGESLIRRLSEHGPDLLPGSFSLTVDQDVSGDRRQLPVGASADVRLFLSDPSAAPRAASSSCLVAGSAGG